MNNKIWTDATKIFIRENCDKLKDRELAEEISKMIGKTVTMEATRKQRQKLKIKKSPGREVCKVKQERVFVAIGINQPNKS